MASAAELQTRIDNIDTALAAMIADSVGGSSVRTGEQEEDSSTRMRELRALREMYLSELDALSPYEHVTEIAYDRFA